MGHWGCHYLGPLRPPRRFSKGETLKGWTFGSSSFVLLFLLRGFPGTVGVALSTPTSGLAHLGRGYFSAELLAWAPRATSKAASAISLLCTLTAFWPHPYPTLLCLYPALLLSLAFLSPQPRNFCGSQKSHFWQWEIRRVWALILSAE